jgi:hypothetical protein
MPRDGRFSTILAIAPEKVVENQPPKSLTVVGFRSSSHPGN